MERILLIFGRLVLSIGFALILLSKTGVAGEKLYDTGVFIFIVAAFPMILGCYGQIGKKPQGSPQAVEQ